MHVLMFQRSTLLLGLLSSRCVALLPELRPVRARSPKWKVEESSNSVKIFPAVIGSTIFRQQDQKVPHNDNVQSDD